MSVKTIEYRLNAAANTFRGRSSVIWADCPYDQIKNGEIQGQCFDDDFTMLGNVDMTSAYAGSLGQWSVAGSAGATMIDGALEGGVAQFGSNGDQEGVTLVSSAGSFRLVTTSTLALNQKLWFETRIARSSIATIKGDFFVGLMTPSLSSSLPTLLPITTTDDTLSTTPSFLGFHLTSSTATRGGPTEVAVAFNLAGGTVNYPTNMTTLMASTGQTVLAASTFVKLGFLFDPAALPQQIASATARQTAGTVRKALIRFFVNGVELPAFLDADDVQNATSGQAFPTGFMAPTLAVMNTTGSTPPTMLADWIRVAQLPNS